MSNWIPLEVTKGERGTWDIWYPDGDHCANVRGNLSTTEVIDGETLARMFASAPFHAQGLAEVVRHLQAVVKAEAVERQCAIDDGAPGHSGGWSQAEDDPTQSHFYCSECHKEQQRLNSERQALLAAFSAI